MFFKISHPADGLPVSTASVEQSATCLAKSALPTTRWPNRYHGHFIAIFELKECVGAISIYMNLV
jgi:hypothetical protein